MLVCRLVIFIIMHLLEKLVDLIFIQAFLGPLVLVLVSLMISLYLFSSRIVNLWLFLNLRFILLLFFDLKFVLLLFLYLKFGSSGDNYRTFLFSLGYHFQLGPLLLR